MDSLERRAVIGLALLYVFRMLGLFMVLPVLAVYVDDFTGSTAMTIGLALGCYGLTQAILQIPLGMASDRWGRKPVIMFGLLLFGIGSLVAAMADSIYGVILGRALQGTGAIASTVMALAADLTHEENRTKAMASIGASIGLSFAVALVLGPIISASWGVAGIFWLTALLALVGFFIVIFVIPTPEAKHEGRRETLTVPHLLGTALRDRELLRHNAGVFILHFVLMALFVELPVVLEFFKIPRAEHGMVYLPLLLLSFFLAYPLMMLAEKRRQLKKAFIIALATLVLALLLLLAAVDRENGWWLVVGGLFCFFVAFNWLEATLPSLMSKLAPAGSKGTAMGVYSSSQFLGAFAGGAGGGVLAMVFGGQAVFVAALVLVVLWLCLISAMPPPRYLKRVVFSCVTEQHVQALKQQAGVEDVVFVEQEATVYLKVDYDAVDQKALKQLVTSS